MSCYLCHYNTATSPTLPLPLSPKANSLTLDKHPWHGYLRGRGGGSRTADKKDTALLGHANSQLHSEEDVGRHNSSQEHPSILDWPQETVNGVLEAVCLFNKTRHCCPKLSMNVSSLQSAAVPHCSSSRVWAHLLHLVLLSPILTTAVFPDCARGGRVVWESLG